MTKNRRPVPAGGRKEANMKFQHGVWSYKGKTYGSLYEALVDIWSKQ